MQIPRMTVSHGKSQKRHSKTSRIESSKEEKNIDQTIRKAAKGYRQSVLGSQLSGDKLIQEYA